MPSYSQGKLIKRITIHRMPALLFHIMPYPPENEIQSGSWHHAGLHSYAGILKIAATTSGPLLTTSNNQAHHGLSLMMLSSEQCT